MPHYNQRDNIGDEELDETYGDWNDPPLWQTVLPVLAALIVGAVVGLVVGAQVFGSSKAPGSVNSEACLLLASELYRQGESIEVVREHLAALGYNNAAPTLLKMADDFAASGEIRKQRQSADLRQLGQALLATAQKSVTPTVVPVTSAQTAIAISSPQPTVPAKSPTPAPTTTTVPTKPPTAVPAATATKPPAATPTPIKPTPMPTATQSPTPPSEEARPARITSSGGEGAVLRKQPTTASEALAYLSHGTRVEVLQLVTGEAIDPVEPRWYQIRYGSLTGYVYFKLIVLGE